MGKVFTRINFKGGSAGTLRSRDFVAEKISEIIPQIKQVSKQNLLDTSLTNDKLKQIRQFTIQKKLQ